MTILYFVIALGLLVFIHEFGHFLAAKKQGIGVEKFSIGFGPKLFGWTRGETTYMVSALPFGGYVKLHGEDPADSDASDPRSYAARPVLHRIAVVFAGPFMNLVLALLLMPLVFLIGRMEPAFLDQKPVVIGILENSPAEKIGLKKGDEILRIDGQETSTWKGFLDTVLLHGGSEVELQFKRGDEILSRRMTVEESAEHHAGTSGIEPTYFIGNDPVIDGVAPGSSAAAAGIHKGDRVVKINQAPITTWTEMSEKIGAGEGKKVEVTVKRGTETFTLSLAPRYDESLKKWLIGVQKDTTQEGLGFVRKQYPFGEAIKKGVEEDIKLTGLTFTVLGRLVTGRLSYKTLGGPIRIAQASAMAAKTGLSNFIYFLAFLSLQLGVLNLLPMPALDGGHLLFFAIEGIQRKPLSMRIRLWMEQAGFILLISLMLLVSLNDVESIWGFRHILDSIKHLF